MSFSNRFYQEYQVSRFVERHECLYHLNRHRFKTISKTTTTTMVMTMMKMMMIMVRVVVTKTMMMVVVVMVMGVVRTTSPMMMMMGGPYNRTRFEEVLEQSGHERGLIED